MEQREQPPQKAAAAISAARFLYAFVFPKSEQELPAFICKAARFFMFLSFLSQNGNSDFFISEPRARRGAAPFKPFPPMLRAITAKRPMEQREQPPQKAAAAISAARFLHAFVFPKSEQELSASIFKAARSAQGSAYQAFSAHAPRDNGQALLRLLALPAPSLAGFIRAAPKGLPARRRRRRLLISKIRGDERPLLNSS